MQCVIIRGQKDKVVMIGSLDGTVILGDVFHVGLHELQYCEEFQRCKYDDRGTY